VATQNYAYDAAVDSLRAQGLPRCQPNIFNQKRSNFEILMTIIGSICRQGNVQEKKALLSTIRKEKPCPEDIFNSAFQKSGQPSISPEDIFQSAYPSAFQKPRQSSSSSEDRVRQTTPPNGDAGRLPGHYTQMLKEYCDRNHVSLSYETKTLSLSPPLYQTNLKFGDKLFQAEDSTKKRAKHLASIKACEELQLRLE
jgi:hypothetical protein